MVAPARDDFTGFPGLRKQCGNPLPKAGSFMGKRPSANMKLTDDHEIVDDKECFGASGIGKPTPR
jgi:hypothetical protein